MRELRDIVVQAQLGDENAYNEIYARFKDMAFSYAYSILGDLDLAEDARQEAFTDAYCDLMALRNPSTFPKWFKQIVYHRSLRIKSHRSVLTVPIDEAFNIGSDAPSPRQRYQENERREKVIEAIEILPENEREVTSLYYIEEYSQQEISEIVGIAPKTVKSRLHTARARLRQRLMDMVKDEMRIRRKAGDRRAHQEATVEAIATFDAELSTLASMSQERVETRAVQLLCAKGRMLRFLGETDQAIASFEEGMGYETLRKAPLLRARLRTEVGLTLIQTAAYAEARKEFLASRTVVRRVGDESGLMAAITNGLGMCSWGMGDFKQARNYYSESVNLCESKEEAPLRADAENNLALLDWKAGRLTKAIKHLRVCLKLWEKAGAVSESAIVLMNIGVMEENLGRFTPAERHYKEALKRATEVKNIQAQSAVYGNLASLTLNQQRYVKAIEHSEKSFDLAKQAGDRRSQAIALENKALSHLYLEQVAEMEQALADARKLARSICDRERLFSLDLVDIEARLTAGNLDDTRPRLQRAQRLMKKHEYASEGPRLLRLRALAAHLAGDERQARAAIDAGLEQCHEQKARPEEKRLKALQKQITGS